SDRYCQHRYLQTFPTRRSSDLTIIVDEGSRIDVSGKGLLGDSSAGRYTGGSHGGRGGNYGSQLSGPVYGEYQTQGQTTDFHNYQDRKSTRLNSSHVKISYADFR